MQTRLLHEQRAEGLLPGSNFQCASDIAITLSTIPSLRNRRHPATAEPSRPLRGTIWMDSDSSVGKDGLRYSVTASSIAGNLNQIEGIKHYVRTVGFGNEQIGQHLQNTVARRTKFK